jgi:hypothetical protein
METIFVYLSLSFLTLWIVAFSLSMGSLLWFQLVQFIQMINARLDELGDHASEFIHRLLFYLHLSR